MAVEMHIYPETLQNNMALTIHFFKQLQEDKEQN